MEQTNKDLEINLEIKNNFTLTKLLKRWIVIGLIGAFLTIITFIVTIIIIKSVVSKDESTVNLNDFLSYRLTILISGIDLVGIAVLVILILINSRKPRYNLTFTIGVISIIFCGLLGILSGIKIIKIIKNKTLNN